MNRHTRSQNPQPPDSGLAWLLEHPPQALTEGTLQTASAAAIAEMCERNPHLLQWARGQAAATHRGAGLNAARFISS